jgi:hypothetical protein
MFSEDQVGGTEVSLMEVGSKSKGKTTGEERNWEEGTFNLGLYLACLPQFPTVLSI